MEGDDEERVMKVKVKVKGGSDVCRREERRGPERAART